MRSRGVVVAALAALMAACATPAPRALPIPTRDLTERENRYVLEALVPLLDELADPNVHRKGCAIAVAVGRSPRINAMVARSNEAATPCTSFALMLTEGALTRLPVGMLRAVLAHELGHVALGHRGANSKALESDADDFAVRLLKRLEPRYADACVQLVYVFSVMPQQGGATEWFAAHPSPDRRAERTLEGCNRR